MEITNGLKVTIISFLEGTLTQSQADELTEWLQEDKYNKELFRQVEEMWHASRIITNTEPDIKDGLRRMREKITERNIRRLPAKEVRFNIHSLVLIAASILILITLTISGFIIYSGRSKPGVKNTAMVEAIVPRGSRSAIILPDSTTVWLNSDTRLRYSTDYNLTHRTIYLDGEAYFKVSKNANLLFQVNTSEIKITALGTAFNVKAYRDEGTIETTLEEGEVSIDLINPEKKEKAMETILLKPKQTAVYKKQEGNISLKENKNNNISKVMVPKKQDVLYVQVNEVPDTKLYTSWKDPKWIFRNEKLSSLVPKLERRYNVKIQIVDKPVEEYTFTGALLEESIEQVLAAIQLTSPIRYEINSQEVRLYEDKYLQKQYRSILFK